MGRSCEASARFALRALRLTSHQGNQPPMTALCQMYTQSHQKMYTQSHQNPARVIAPRDTLERDTQTVGLNTTTWRV